MTMDQGTSAQLAKLTTNGKDRECIILIMAMCISEILEKTSLMDKEFTYIKVGNVMRENPVILEKMEEEYTII